MPAAVVAAVSSFGAAIGGVSGAFLIVNAVAIGTALYYAGAVLIGSAYAAHQRRKAIRQYNAGLQDRLVMVASADGARSRVYGRVRHVDGVGFKGSSGANKEKYTLVVELAGHEIDAVETVYFDDVALTLDGSGYVTNAPYTKADKKPLQAGVSISAGAGSVVLPSTPVAGSTAVVLLTGTDAGSVSLAHTVSGNTVTVSDDPSYSGGATVTYQTVANTALARVRSFLGAPSQDLSSLLTADFPTLINSGEHKFAGIACLLVELTYDQDAFATGVPSITALMRGAKVLDPRTSTTAWTENPALIARDWALHANGGGMTSGALHAASFNAAANACDVVHGFVTDGVTTNRPMFTCGIALKLDQDPWAGFLEIVESMAGKAGWAGGQLRVVAGAWRTPAFAIDDTWLSGVEQVQIVPEPPMEESVNVYRPRIADAAQAYVPAQVPEIRAAAYVTLDGRDLVREIDMGGVTDLEHAQHVCGVLMRDARNGLTLKLPCNFKAYELELFDIGTVNLERFGFVAKQFEVIDWQFSLHGGIVLTLKETASTIFDPDATFNAHDDTPNTALPSPTVVPTLGTLNITSGGSALTDTGSVLTRTRVAWPAVADESVRNLGRVEIQYWQGADALPAGDWTVWEERGSATEAVIPALRAGYVYVFRGRAVNALGVKGPWGVLKAHRIGSVELIDTPQIADNAVTNGATVVTGYGLQPIQADSAAADRFTVVLKAAGSSGTNLDATYVGNDRPVYITCDVESIAVQCATTNSPVLATIGILVEEVGVGVIKSAMTQATMRTFNAANGLAANDGGGHGTSYDFMHAQASLSLVHEVAAYTGSKTFRMKLAYNLLTGAGATVAPAGASWNSSITHIGAILTVREFKK